jgi:hypothetical protein
MRTSGRWMMTVVSGSLIVLLPGGRSVTAAPPGQIKEIKVGITPQGSQTCNHHVAPDFHSLKKDQDALGWRVKSTCRLDQDVLLCVYRRETGQLHNPFHPCQDDPATRDVGKIFRVTAGTTVNLDCPAKDAGRYRKVILVGDEVPATGCPPQVPRVVRPRLHRIGIDIVP